MSRREYLTDLRAACSIGTDGRSHLGEFCDRHAVEVGEVAVGDGYEIPGSVEVIHVPGYEPESPQSIICDLIDEIERLTEASEENDRMRKVDKAFYDLTVLERNQAWRELAALTEAAQKVIETEPAGPLTTPQYIEQTRVHRAAVAALRAALNQEGES